jgi:curli biogenesis system outer membrane secretion channel CsgG
MTARALAIMLALAPGGLATIAATPALEAQERPRVAVLTFDNPTDWFGRQLGASAASQLTVRLVNSGEFSVLERQRVEEVDQEAFRGQTGRIPAQQAIELGRQLGAEYLITGEFTHFNINTLRVGRGPLSAYESRAESAMNVRVINATTGEITAASQADGNVVLGRGLRVDDTQIGRDQVLNPTLADRALGPAIEKLVDDLVRQKTRFAGAGAEPRGALITGFADDGSVYLDQGENGGIQVGTRFQVLRVVDEIRDSNGNVLDQITERVGMVEVVRVLSQSAIAAVREGRPDINDRLEPASGS